MTPQQAEFAKLWRDGLTYAEIVAVMDVPHATLATWRKRLRLPTRYTMKEAAERREAIAPLLADFARRGLTLRQMADQLGKSENAVKKWLDKLAIRRTQRSVNQVMTSRICIRCRRQFMHTDPPKVKRLCHGCTSYADSHASALA